MQRAAGLEATCIPVLGLVLIFVFHLEPLYYQHELNRIWEHYKNLPEGTTVPLAVAVG